MSKFCSIINKLMANIHAFIGKFNIITLFFMKIYFTEADNIFGSFCLIYKRQTVL